MTSKTQSELLFEDFCLSNGLDFEPIPVSTTPTPDYQIKLTGAALHVEIKQIESLVGFNPNGVSSRTSGSHVRGMINEARRQVKSGATDNQPSILLIYNSVDPLQLFGTEQHDFIAAMYGEMTVTLVKGKISDSFHGRNAKLRHDANTYFSGVGHMERHTDGVKVTVYENAYSKNPLPFSSIPSCIKVVRAEISQDA